MGGEAKVRKQHERGKWTARERLDRFFDGGTWFEVGIHGTQMAHFGADKPPADAVICGWGHVDGRMVCAAAYDFTVKGGSIGQTGETKVSRLRELALRNRMPMVWFIDSAGARIDPQSGQNGDLLSLFAGAGALFREEVIMSGVVPLVAAMVGPGAAGTAYIPGLADFVPMLKDIGSMALGGPPLVKAVTGQDISEQELGGTKVHAEKSGVGDVEVADDPSASASSRSTCRSCRRTARSKPPIVVCADPIERARRAAARDPARVDAAVVRHVRGHPARRRLRRLLDIKPKFAKAMITGLARIGGRPVRHRRQQPAPDGRHPRPTTRPTRRRTSSRSATRSTCRSSS